MNPPVSPYVTHRQLIPLIKADYLIEVVCMTEPYLKASVWYGEWTIQVPEQRGGSERFLVSARSNDGPHLRTFKTGYGVISFMWKLGFRTISLPMEKGASVSNRIGSKSAISPEPASATANERTPVSLDTVRTGLLHLSQHGFVSVRSAAQLIEAGYAVPEQLEVHRYGVWPYIVDTVRLTDAGQTMASTVAQRAALPDTPTDLILDWERVITEDYIRQQADAGVLVENIICAKAWYTGPENPECRGILEPTVNFPRLNGTPWVPLYICDDEVDELVEKLMRITGAKTETEVVRKALEAALEPRHKQPSLVDRIRPLQACVAALGAVNPDFNMKAFTDEL